jgi:hypothetical protein
MTDNNKASEVPKPDTKPIEPSVETYFEARLKMLEDRAATERFKEDTYYPNLIKSERELGELFGRLDEFSKMLTTTTRKVDNAVVVVNDHDSRMGTQFTAFENRIEAVTRKMTEVGSQFDQIITYIRDQQEAEKDRQVIMQRGQRVFTLAARIIFAIFAGLGGLQAFDQILKVILGGN